MPSQNSAQKYLNPLFQPKKIIESPFFRHHPQPINSEPSLTFSLRIINIAEIHGLYSVMANSIKSSMNTNSLIFSPFNLKSNFAILRIRFDGIIVMTNNRGNNLSSWKVALLMPTSPSPFAHSLLEPESVSFLCSQLTTSCCFLPYQACPNKM